LQASFHFKRPTRLCRVAGPELNRRTCKFAGAALHRATFQRNIRQI
jgi:hypothetical protein